MGLTRRQFARASLVMERRPESGVADLMDQRHEKTKQIRELAWRIADLELQRDTLDTEIIRVTEIYVRGLSD